MHVLYTQGWDVQAAVAAFNEAWGDFTPSAKYDYLTREHAEDVLRGYAEEHRGDDWFTVIPGTAEQVIIFDYDGEEFGTKPDLPIKVGEQNYALDFKCTTQYLGDSWANKFQHSNQLRGQVKGLQTLLGVPFSGAFVVGIYMGKGNSGKRSLRVGPFFFSESHLHETREWIEGIQDQLRLWKITGRYPQNDQGCVGCDFNPLCDAPPSARPSVMEREFMVREITGRLASGADSK